MNEENFERMKLLFNTGAGRLKCTAYLGTGIQCPFTGHAANGNGMLCHSHLDLVRRARVVLSGDDTLVELEKAVACNDIDFIYNYLGL